jgi:hypothetical protein
VNAEPAPALPIPPYSSQQRYTLPPLAAQIISGLGGLGGELVRREEVDVTFRIPEVFEMLDPGFLPDSVKTKGAGPVGNSVAKGSRSSFVPLRIRAVLRTASRVVLDVMSWCSTTRERRGFESFLRTLDANKSSQATASFPTFGLQNHESFKSAIVIQQTYNQQPSRTRPIPLWPARRYLIQIIQILVESAPIQSSGA